MTRVLLTCSCCTGNHAAANSGCPAIPVHDGPDAGCPDAGCPDSVRPGAHGSGTADVSHACPDGSCLSFLPTAVCNSFEQVRRTLVLGILICSAIQCTQVGIDANTGNQLHAQHQQFSHVHSPFSRQHAAGTRLSSAGAFAQHWPSYLVS